MIHFIWDQYWPNTGSRYFNDGPLIGLASIVETVLKFIQKLETSYAINYAIMQLIMRRYF